MNKKILIVIVIILIGSILIISNINKKDNNSVSKNEVQENIITSTGEEYTVSYNEDMLYYEFKDSNGEVIGTVADEMLYTYYMQNPDSINFMNVEPEMLEVEE